MQVLENILFSTVSCLSSPSAGINPQVLLKQTSTVAAPENIINWRGLFIAIPLVVFVLLLAKVYSKCAKTKRKKTGQYLEYTTPQHNCAKCRSILGQHSSYDIFEYELKGSNSGGWYIHFTKHNPTQQQLDTTFLLQFTGDEPCTFSLSFISEAFGMREAVFGEELLDEFFAQKMGALRNLA